eukprot:10998845-Alexandrium_andersonii.AAC.1
MCIRDSSASAVAATMPPPPPPLVPALGAPPSPEAPPSEISRGAASRRAGPEGRTFFWGAFAFRLTKRGASFSWQCTCPYHALSSKSGCRKAF